MWSLFSIMAQEGFDPDDGLEGFNPDFLEGLLNPDGPESGTDGTGGGAVGVPNSTSHAARDKVLFGQVLLDVLVPFLIPKDLGRLARTCKAGAQAVYDEDGRSVAVSVALDGRGAGRSFFNAASACHLNFVGIRFIHVVGLYNHYHRAEMTEDQMVQIQQLLGPKLERLSMDPRGLVLAGTKCRYLAKSLAISPLTNLRSLEIPAIVAALPVVMSEKNRCRLESFKIFGDIEDFVETSLALQLAAPRSIRTLHLQDFVWQEGRSLSCPAGQFLTRTLPDLNALQIDFCGAINTPIPDIIGYCGNFTLKKFTVSVTDSYRISTDGFQLIQQMGALSGLRVLTLGDLNLAGLGAPLFARFLSGLGAQVEELVLRPGVVVVGTKQLAAAVGLRFSSQLSWTSRTTTIDLSSLPRGVLVMDTTYTST